MKPQAEIGRLILSLVVIVGAAELTTGAVAKSTPQSASSIKRMPLRSTNVAVPDGHPQIVVRIHNYAHVDTGLLLGAEAVATVILREAKVDVRWVYCPLPQEEYDRYPECPTAWGPDAFVLNILTPQMTARIQTRVENLGSAPTPCDDNATSCPISVFYFRVVERAEHFGIQPVRLLGHVLAHEVGHTLGAHHSARGIMRGEWGRDELKLMGFSILEFSTDEANQLRATVIQRARQQELVQDLKLSASR